MVIYFLCGLCKYLLCFRRVRHIGCPNKIEFGRTKNGKDYLIASSKRNALASINVNSGDIGKLLDLFLINDILNWNTFLDWRQINEVDAERYPMFVTHDPEEKVQPCK